MTITRYTDLAPHVFTTWSKHWLGAGYAPPPLVIYKPTMAGGLLLLAPMASPWVRAFVEAQQGDPDVLYETQGEAVTEGNPQYLGTWGAMSAHFRDQLPKPQGIPAIPQALPKVEPVKPDKRRWLA